MHILYGILYEIGTVGAFYVTTTCIVPSSIVFEKISSQSCLCQPARMRVLLTAKVIQVSFHGNNVGSYVNVNHENYTGSIRTKAKESFI